MKCDNCGRENRNDAKFCADCGADLRQTKIIHHSTDCPLCGYKNTPESSFCAECGAGLGRPHREETKKHHHDQNTPKKKKRHVHTKLHWLAVAVTLVILGGVFFLYMGLESINRSRQPQRPVPLVEARSNDPALEAKVTDVASKFICSCGTCGEQALEICSCNTAIQERQFIRSSLQSGQPPNQVIAAVNSNFGWMKPEFAARYDSLQRRTGQSTRLTVPAQKELGPLEATQTKLGTSTVTTAADRIEIFSHFRCPCGQCGIQELKDCECNHPRGATEVKSFVDEK
ncbi:MAG: zinc ribbon domain-containing protein, partial [Bacteroidota bacterium]